VSRPCSIFFSPLLHHRCSLLSGCVTAAVAVVAAEVRVGESQRS